MKYKTDKFKINKKRDELNNLMEKNVGNPLTDEILKVSQELDDFIRNYLVTQDTYNKIRLDKLKKK